MFIILVLDCWTAAFLCTDASTLPVMRTLHSTVVAVRGSDVKLACHGSRVDPLDTTLDWTFNTQKVEDNRNRKIERVWLPKKQASYSLHIFNVSEKDVGDYRCIAKASNFNKGDKGEASIKLRLYESSKYHFFTLPRFISKSNLCPQI